MKDAGRVLPPDVAYARSCDVAVAYQVVGEGPTDIVFVRGITGDLLSTWEQPLLVRYVQGLAASGRVLMLDKRGQACLIASARSSRWRRPWTTFERSWMPWVRSVLSCGAAV
jgi:hypothetical protein